jgi:hypothetical protein
MEHLPPAGWSHLATKQDMELVRTEMQVLRAELKEEIQKTNAQTLRWMIGFVLLANSAMAAFFSQL